MCALKGTDVLSTQIITLIVLRRFPKMRADNEGGDGANEASAVRKLRLVGTCVSTELPEDVSLHLVSAGRPTNAVQHPRKQIPRPKPRERCYAPAKAALFPSHSEAAWYLAER